MANSDIVTSLKEDVIRTICGKDAFFYAISPDKKIENAGDLVNGYIFRFNKNPETIQSAITFLTVTVDIHPRDRNLTFVKPTLTIWVYSHHNHMDFSKEESKLLGSKRRIVESRNDYIAKMIDDTFNGMPQGLGKLKLYSNTEGNAGSLFLYRRLIFETVDFNDSLCGDN